MQLASLAEKAIRRNVVVLSACIACMSPYAYAETIDIGIGTQNTTTNTVTGGVILKEMGLLEKHLPKAGKYKDAKYKITWQNSTSGPPITNGMMADKIQIGMMGDYPLLVNGATGQATKNETQLIAVIAYNAYGGGNGIVVPKDSQYYDIMDLKGKKVSVPFGSAAHGMLLMALQQRGLPPDFWSLVSQSPEIGATNIQEGRIDGHGGFVPFAELLPFRGTARKIFDGAETLHPTFHGVVIRKDFGEKYPEVVVAYIKALLEANDWVRKNPKLASEKIEQWTSINKEVAYMFLGPNGVHTLDPTIKPKLVQALGVDYGVLQRLNMIKDLSIPAWVNDKYVRQAYADLGMNYDAQLGSFSNYMIKGDDPVCKTPITKPSEAGQIWVQGGDISSYSSPVCTLMGVKKLTSEGKKLGAVYLMDRALGIKVFADAAFYSVDTKNPAKPEIVPFVLKRDAEQYVKKSGGKVSTYAEALSAVPAVVH